MSTLAYLVENARWEENGRELSGCDCYGLARIARQVLEGRHDLPAYVTPKQFKHCERVVRDELDLHWTEIPRGQEQPGDFILIKKRGLDIHVGYVTRRGWMLHIEENCNAVHVRYGCTLEHPWKKIAGFFRYEPA
jgi:cell wall-associated NlpC family hydrolase